MNLIENYKNKYLDKISVCFVSFLLSLAFIKTIMHYLPKTKSLLSIIILTALVTLIWYSLKPIRSIFIWSFLGLHGFLMLSAVQGISLFAKIYIKLTIPYVEFFEKLFLNSNNGGFYKAMLESVMKSMMDSDVLLEKKYVTFFWMSLTILISLLLLIFVENRVSWMLMSLPGLYYFVGWFFYVSSLEINFAFYLVAVIIYKQFLNYEQLDLDNKKGHDDYTKPFILTVVMVTLLLSFSTLVVWLLPTEKINNKINNFIPTIEGLRDEFPVYKSGRTFSFARTMYAPYGKILGGPIKDRSYERIMRVKSDEGGLYLRGRVQNIYDGKSWTSDFSTYRLRTTITDLPDDFELDAVTAIEIYPDFIKTRTIFSPYIFVKSSFKDNQVYQNDVFLPIIKKTIEADFKPYTAYYLKDSKEPVLESADRNYYLGLPETGLPITRRLAKELTEDLKSDGEKMQALVDHLRANYSYSLEPEFYQGPIDFVEKFIAEDKIGYCTYFASSLAVMARSVNIPTRYVEGYLSGYYKDQEGFYDVTANRAHAWVEAYIEGEGWRVYEATPSYSEPGEISFIETPSSTNELSEAEDDGLLKIEEPTEDFNLNRDDLVPASLVADKVADKNTYMVWLFLVLTFVALIFYIVIRKKKKSNKDKIIAMIYLMNKVSQRYKVEAKYRWPKKAILCFLKEDLNLILSEKAQLIVDETLYSSCEVTKENLEIFMIVYKEFFKKILEYKGIFVYLKIKIESIFY